MSEPPASRPIAFPPPDEDGIAVVGGAALSYRAWGRKGLPGVVLVHGGTAHQRWWDHIAPLLASGRRVVTFDMAGHGDSVHLPRYGYDMWADEVIGVATAAGVGSRPILIGHSMGGVVSLNATLRHGEAFGGLIIVESVIDHLSHAELERRTRRTRGRHRVYATREEAIARFHTIPSSALLLPSIRDYVAAASVRETSEGWTWKFDLRIFGQDPVTPDHIRPLPCRVALVRGEHGTMTERISEEVRRRLSADRPVHVIAGAGHHIMLEQPDALTAHLDSVLNEWAGA